MIGLWKIHNECLSNRQRPNPRQASQSQRNRNHKQFCSSRRIVQTKQVVSIWLRVGKAGESSFVSFHRTNGNLNILIKFCVRSWIDKLISRPPTRLTFPKHKSVPSYPVHGHLNPIYCYLVLFALPMNLNSLIFLINIYSLFSIAWAANINKQIPEYNLMNWLIKSICFWRFLRSYLNVQKEAHCKKNTIFVRTKIYLRNRIYSQQVPSLKNSKNGNRRKSSFIGFLIV